VGISGDTSRRPLPSLSSDMGADGTAAPVATSSPNASAPSSSSSAVAQESSWFSRVSDAYNMLWKMIIRPPRDVYSLEELGPAKFRLGKRIYERRDLQLRSARGHVLECSHFVPAKSPEALRPCVVYLHGNCSSRLEAFDALPVLLPRDLTVFCLDLSGSGRSEGEYISLGHHEEKDLEVVLEHLRQTGRVSSIGLWGRSMGAATSILRAADDPDLSAAVLDSAFGDLRTVAEELVNRGSIKIPQFLVNMGLEVIRSEVKNKAQFDPHDLMPIKFAPKARCPALFGVAQDDTFVLPHHTQDLHNAWNGERVLRVFDGGHNGVRPAWFLEEAADFLAERLNKADGSVPEPKGDSAHETPRPDVMAPPRSDEKQRSKVADELVKMGFGGDMAFEAAKRHSTVEAATAWLLHQSGRTQGEQAGISRPIRTDKKADGDNASDSKLKKGGSASSASGLGTGGVVEELMFLGFHNAQAEEAAKRCSSLEDAMEWLMSQDVMVSL